MEIKKLIQVIWEIIEMNCMECFGVFGIGINIFEK
jgi:hypothetical protein